MIGRNHLHGGRLRHRGTVTRCAECGRTVERRPFRLGRLVLGWTCATRLGLIQPRPRRIASPRPVVDYGPATEVLPGQDMLPLDIDEEGIENHG